MVSRILAIALLALASLGVTAAAVEVGFRVFQRLRYDVPVGPSPAALGRDAGTGAARHLSSIVLDDVLGWRSTPFYDFHGSRQNSDGSTYPVHVSFDAQGFRTFGRLDSARRRVLAIGDSFTQAVEVSDDQPYYRLLGQALDAEVFAYGAGGYGTLQEYLILDLYVDQIQPDLLLWQYCSNDFMNNDWELERQSWFANNGLLRPYWEHGTIQYRLPKPDPLGVRTLAEEHSRFGYWLLSRLDSLQRSLAGKEPRSIEHEIEAQGVQHPAFARAITITDQLMEFVRQRVPEIPIVAFNCDDARPYREAFEEISARHDIAFVTEVSTAIRDAEAEGWAVTITDGHWNEWGHQIVAERLEDYLHAVGWGAAR
jgi:lysophospholipase L1-like esterase